MTITNPIGADFQFDVFVRNGMDHAKTSQEAQAVYDAAKTLYDSSISLLKADGAYAHLTQQSGTNGNTLAGVNIRADLKEHFPGVRFSVRRRRNANVIGIEWVEGPPSEAVWNIVSKYQNYFDEMDDLSTAFHDVFGEALYVSIQRVSIALHIDFVAKPNVARQRLALRMLAAEKLYDLISYNLEKFTVLKSIPGYVAFCTLLEGEDTQTRLHLIEDFLTRTAASGPITDGALPRNVGGAIAF